MQSNGRRALRKLCRASISTAKQSIGTVNLPPRRGKLLPAPPFSFGTPGSPPLAYGSSPPCSSGGGGGGGGRHAQVCEREQQEAPTRARLRCQCAPPSVWSATDRWPSDWRRCPQCLRRAQRSSLTCCVARDRARAGKDRCTCSKHTMSRPDQHLRTR
jgi:hypothetical protein